MKKYLIFDLDGTLISSKAYLKRTITEYFNTNYPDYLDSLNYRLDYSMIGNFDDLLTAIFKEELDINEINKIKKELYNLINSNIDNVGFISGTIETINKIKDDFTIFLSTGNSTEFAKEMLKKGGILEHFEIIIGSEIIPKTVEHIELMKDHVGDINFCEHALFIGDGPRDREIAEIKGIKYIRIGGKGGYNSISEIDFYSI